MRTKRCRDCGIEKPVTEYYKHPATRDRLFQMCKKCAAVRERLYKDKKYPSRLVERERRRIRKEKLECGVLQCTECGTDKSLSHFNKKNACGKEWDSVCKECHAAYSRQYRKDHPDWSAASGRRWVEKNKQRKYTQNRQRIYSIRSNGGLFTQEEWDNLCLEFDNRCVCCGEKTALTVDHIVPISPPFCGTSNIENIQPLCRPCNSRKNNRYIIDYRATFFEKFPQYRKKPA